MESAFGMRIPDADPEDQNHADPCGCGCGSATLERKQENHGLGGLAGFFGGEEKMCFPGAEEEGTWFLKTTGRMLGYGIVSTYQGQTPEPGALAGRNPAPC